MSERKTYSVYWKITGKTLVRADNEAEARLKHAQFQASELAEEGELMVEEVSEHVEDKAE